MQNIISKLNTLKSIEPGENWVIETRKRVLSEAPVFPLSQKGVRMNSFEKTVFSPIVKDTREISWKVTKVRSMRENKAVGGFLSGSRNEALPRLHSKNALNRVSAALFSKRMAVSAFAFVFLISGGILTVKASESSVPGNSLYPVKIAAENATLAIAPREKKPEIEIEQAGKRLEELAVVSKKPSDSDQKKKTEQLLASFEKKVNNAQSSLTKVEDNGIKAKVAKVINDQTEKYTEVLAKTSENLPDVVKDKVSEKLASAVNSNEKVNFQSLATMVDTVSKNGEGKEEVAAKVKAKIDKLEEKIITSDENAKNIGKKDSEEAKSAEEAGKNDNPNNLTEKPTDVADGSNNVPKDGEDGGISAPKLKTSAEEAKKSLEEAKKSLKNDDLSEAMKAIMDVNIAVDLKDSGEKPSPVGDESVGDEPVEDAVQDDVKSDVNGKVEGVSDEIKGESGIKDKDGTAITEKNVSLVTPKDTPPSLP